VDARLSLDVLHRCEFVITLLNLLALREQHDTTEHVRMISQHETDRLDNWLSRSSCRSPSARRRVCPATRASRSSFLAVRR